MPLFNATECSCQSLADDFEEALQKAGIDNADLEIELELLLSEGTTFDKLVNWFI